MNEIIHGDSKEVLKTLEDESVDLLCTDPPYGYSFMGKSWDKTLPNIGIFKECFRVLKAGSFAFVMSAPRSDVCARMMLMLEEAGFEIGFTPIYWTYASGFPKASNIAKAIDKRMGVEFETKPAEGVGFMNSDKEDGYHETKNQMIRKGDMSPEAKALDGSYGGFQPKPAVEVVIVAMKPLSEKTYVDQALKNGKGITWLDDVRIPTDRGWNRGFTVMNTEGHTVYGEYGETNKSSHEAGRFPANLLVSDDVLNDGVERRTGNLTRVNSSIGGNGIYQGGMAGERNHTGDSGSYSRYFDLDAWAKTLPFLIVPKASKSEKNAGLDDLPKGPPPASARTKPAEGRKNALGEPRANHHPTVKPLKLMSYLITLGSRHGDVVLDPFVGSGTTCLAAKQLGRKYIGIEREKEYVEIANARLASMQDSLFHA